MVVERGYRPTAPPPSTPGRNCGDVLTAETAEGAEVFGQDRRDIVMSIRTPLEFRRNKGRSEAKSKGAQVKKGFAPFSYVIVFVKRWTRRRERAGAKG